MSDKPKTSADTKPAQAAKPTMVQAGRYKGAQAIVYGTDVDLFNKGVIALSREDSPEALDYVKRITLDLLPLMKKVYYAQIDGKNVFLNEVELEEPKKEVKHYVKSKSAKSKDQHKHQN